MAKKKENTDNKEVLGENKENSAAKTADAGAENGVATVSYTHLRAHETRHDLVCRLLLEKKKLTLINISETTRLRRI